VKRQINAVLRRRGYQIQKLKPPRPKGQVEPLPLKRRNPRKLKQPTFVLSTVRSGSTLLRLLLDSHSQIHAPHEMHLNAMRVEIGGKYGIKALSEVKLDSDEMQFVLWDWYLHRQLASTGKRLLVNKTPSDVWITDKILECWPDARFIFLLRHPVSVARSRSALRPQDRPEQNYKRILKYGEAVEAARQSLPGHTVRYEDLASDPAGETQKLCAFLGVDWEPTMLEYGTFSHGKLRAGLGDWKDNIKTGTVQPPKPLPARDEIPPELLPLAIAWGYVESAPADAELERAEG
jgi:hypothetical protein